MHFRIARYLNLERDLIICARKMKETRTDAFVSSIRIYIAAMFSSVLISGLSCIYSDKYFNTDLQFKVKDNGHGTW